MPPYFNRPIRLGQHNQTVILLSWKLKIESYNRLITVDYIIDHGSLFCLFNANAFVKFYMLKTYLIFYKLRFYYINISFPFFYSQKRRAIHM